MEGMANISTDETSANSIQTPAADAPPARVVNQNGYGAESIKVLKLSLIHI